MSDGWQRRQAQTRQAVLDAVGALIAAEGVEALSVRRLAERAGVAVATLYNQFGDRQGILVSFVENGLDQLEGELDAAPPQEPIDVTRALFAAFDGRFASEPDVWRPIFATLGSGPGVHGMGEIGDRVVATITADLEKAAADGRLIHGCDTALVARHVFHTRMSRLERWANGVLDWETYLVSSQLGLELILAAILVEPHRSDALDRSGALGESGR